MVPQNTSKNIKILCLKTWHCYDIVLIKSHSSIALLMFVKLQISVITVSLVNMTAVKRTSLILSREK